jgi:hypothetical protein
VGGIFGNFHSISVSGNVYNDLDGNGLKNGGEPGLAGWTVNLEDSSGTILASATTDPSGNYSITGVGAGSYQIAEVVQTNWVQTQPQYPTVYSFTTQSGHNLVALNFGDHSAPLLIPTQVIDNGQAGYSETGSWSTVVGGFNGTNRVARTQRAGGGASATATWDFTGAGSGIFDVYVTFAGKATYSHAAPFTVYDGGTSLGTQSINESILVTQSQGGRAQGSYGGVGWLELGTFTISSGELKVVLSDVTSGNYVDADGVLIISHGAGPSVVTANSTGTSMGTVPPADTNPIQKSNTTTVSIKNVSPSSSSVSVTYSQNAPAQAVSSPAPVVIDLALSDLASEGLGKKKGQS